MVLCSWVAAGGEAHKILICGYSIWYRLYCVRGWWQVVKRSGSLSLMRCIHYIILTHGYSVVYDYNVLIRGYSIWYINCIVFVGGGG